MVRLRAESLGLSLDVETKGGKSRSQSRYWDWALKVSVSVSMLRLWCHSLSLDNESGDKMIPVSVSRLQPQSRQSLRPHQLSEDDNYRSLSALDQLTLFQKLKGLETDEVPPLLSAPSSTIFSRRPQTAGRLNRARSKGRRSQSIFGQGSLEQET